MKISLVGGGTAGSVMPLMALKTEISRLHPEAEFFYIGTFGPENRFLHDLKIRRYRLISGKFRRYFSLRNILDILLIIWAWLTSIAILLRERPEAVVSAGSFVAVPVSYAAVILGIKVYAHQQDLLPGLSNRLIFPIVRHLTVSLKETEKGFLQGTGLFRTRNTKRKKLVYTGNPIREEITRGDEEKAEQKFGLKKDFPTLLVIGGSSGAQQLNSILWHALPELLKYFQVVHVTGQKYIKSSPRIEGYNPVETVGEEFSDLVKKADIVITRAGFSTLSELAVCRKTVIIIPMPNSHQEFNARYFMVREAAIVAQEQTLTPQILVAGVRKILFDGELKKTLSNNIGSINPKNAAVKIAELILRDINVK